MPPEKNEKPDKRVLASYGREVRRLREEAGLTQTALARRANSSKTTISEVERGVTPPVGQLRAALDEALGNGRLTHLWKELTGSGGEVWKYEIAELIDGASAVYEYEVLVFPAYLQTQEYARAIIRHGAPWLPTSEVERMAEERWKRSQRIAERENPRLWLVMDGSVLLRRYGSAEVMRRQLAHVTDLAVRGRITLQMVPPDAPTHPGVSGAYKLITTDHVPEVLVAESIREGQVITNTMEVANYRMQFSALQGIAMNPIETLTRFQDEIARLER
ncbi:helix-turn-helix transcriptional regulator [Nocardiopsis sp. FR4]|uniref:helix-turn-helix domain-containing protein n=1 Tax=Nocardiopsis sp. FR4 TaxID=2605985 RepID=UPI001358CF7B|nr:helix-turn-helix transcriptional regulator [Nocardiopsis sp. FR4]